MHDSGGGADHYGADDIDDDVVVGNDEFDGDDVWQY